MRRRRSWGIALIAVLLVTLTLMVMTMGFATFTTQDYKSTKDQIDALTTMYLAEAGLEYSSMLFKRNMTVYPCPIDNGGNYYLYDDPYDVAASDARPTGDGTTDNAGAALNVFPNALTGFNGHYHVVISGLSFDSLSDLLGDTEYCGVFRIRQVTSPISSIIRIESVGMIKEIPEAERSKDDTDSTKWARVGDNSYFTVRAQRTLYETFTLETGSRSPITDARKDITIGGWSEKIR